MTNSEIFSKCLPHTASLTPGVGGIPELTWEDVLAALGLCGIEKKHEGFIRYVYLDDPKGHHDFFAGLMAEVCSRSDIQQWANTHEGQIEKLVLFAIREWKYSRYKYTDETRAYAFRVRLYTWRRHFKNTYSVIVGAPTYWEDQVLQLLRQKLQK